MKDFGTIGETKEKCGKGKRMIITDAITAEGPIKDALWIFKASKTSEEKKCKKGSKYKKKLPRRHRRRQKVSG